MNLDNLKPAWLQFRLSNSMRAMDHEEILLMLELAEGRAVNKGNKFLMYTLMFIVLTLCCQGG
jgi:hypothetical protein